MFLITFDVIVLENKSYVLSKCARPFLIKTTFVSFNYNIDGDDSIKRCRSALNLGYFVP